MKLLKLRITCITTIYIKWITIYKFTNFQKSLLIKRELHSVFSFKLRNQNFTMGYMFFYMFNLFYLWKCCGNENHGLKSLLESFPLSLLQRMFQRHCQNVTVHYQQYLTPQNEVSFYYRSSLRSSSVINNYFNSTIQTDTLQKNWSLPDFEPD